MQEIPIIFTCTKYWLVPGMKYNMKALANFTLNTIKQEHVCLD